MRYKYLKIEYNDTDVIESPIIRISYKTDYDSDKKVKSQELKDMTFVLNFRETECVVDMLGTILKNIDLWKDDDKGINKVEE